MIEFWGEFALTDKGELHKGVLLTFTSDYKLESVRTEVSRKQATHQHAYCYPNSLLTPAFFNMHSHLEYSFAKDLFKPHQGSVAFIQFMRTMDFPSSFHVIQAASHSFQKAYRQGTHFFCDIENHLTTISFKNIYKQNFLTFFEVLGLNNHDFDSTISRLKTFSFFHPLSITPHSFYALSQELWQGFQKWFDYHRNSFISIHFLESSEERALLEKKEGPLLNYIRTFADWSFSPQSPISWVQSFLPTTHRILLVHNTLIQREEISRLLTHYPYLYFCLCPRSNDYISNQLPPVEWFLQTAPDRVVLGTDSLASNSSLHVWDEIRFLKQKGILMDYPDIAKMLWLNPSRFLFGQEIGLRAGFSPGLVRIQGDWEHFSQVETSLLLPARYPKITQLSYL